MAEGKTNNAELLIRLFEETDQVKLSEKDIDKELKDLGIESEEIVAEGLGKINKIIETNESQSRYNMPMAASNKEELSQEDVLRLLREDDGTKETKS